MCNSHIEVSLFQLKHLPADNIFNMVKKCNTNKTMSEAKYCGVCNKTFNKSEYRLLCSGKCMKWICQKCSCLSKAQCEALAEKNGTWICGSCLSPKMNTSRKSIPLPAESKSSDEESESEKDDFENCTISDIMKQLKLNHTSMCAEIKTLKTDVTVMQQSLQFLSDSYEEMQKENKSIKMLQEEKKCKLEILNRVEKLERKVEHMEQEKRDRNVIITNMPLQEKEDTKVVVIKLMDFMKITSLIGEFSAKRLSKKENSPILMELRDSQMRNIVLQKRKESGQLRAAEIGYSGNNVIYFHEDLSKMKQELYAKVRKDLKDEKGFKYTWIKNGRILVKKTDSSPVITISTEEDLIKIN